MPASVVCAAGRFSAQLYPHFIGREETDMIKRKDNPVMQFIIGAGSPVTWTAVLLIAVWFWS
jgi:hypothetical protein